MVTAQQIKTELAAAIAQTRFSEKTNQTYYPAAWRYDAGVGDAGTACYYDRRIELAAQHVAASHEWPALDCISGETVNRRTALRALIASRDAALAENSALEER